MAYDQQGMAAQSPLAGLLGSSGFAQGRRMQAPSFGAFPPPGQRHMMGQRPGGMGLGQGMSRLPDLPPGPPSLGGPPGPGEISYQPPTPMQPPGGQMPTPRPPGMGNQPVQPPQQFDRPPGQPGMGQEMPPMQPMPRPPGNPGMGQEMPSMPPISNQPVPGGPLPMPPGPPRGTQPPAGPPGAARGLAQLMAGRR